MLNVLSKLLFRTTGFIAAFIFACNNIDLNSIYVQIKALAASDKTLDALAPAYVKIGFEVAFVLLCLAVIIIAYRMFLNFTKGVLEGFNLVRHDYAVRRKRLEDFDKIAEKLLDKLDIDEGEEKEAEPIKSKEITKKISF